MQESLSSNGRVYSIFSFNLLSNPCFSYGLQQQKKTFMKKKRHTKNGDVDFLFSLSFLFRSYSFSYFFFLFLHVCLPVPMLIYFFLYLQRVLPLQLSRFILSAMWVRRFSSCMSYRQPFREGTLWDQNNTNQTDRSHEYREKE